MRRIMYRRLSFISPTITILAIVFLANALSQAEPAPLLTRHVRDVVVNGQAPMVGQLPAKQTMHFEVRTQPERLGCPGCFRESERLPNCRRIPRRHGP